jgi:hypothetical protein
MIGRCSYRKLSHWKGAPVDFVITSPPYLNAIDYVRCSKFTLVWMADKCLGAQVVAARLSKRQVQLELSHAY